MAHDELGGLLPIKRTIRVIDAQNQSFREQEVRRSGVGGGEKKGGFLVFMRGKWWVGSPPPQLPAPEGRRGAGCAARWAPAPA